MTLVIQEGEQYLNSFLFALKTIETKRQYSRNLKLFFDFSFDSNLTLGHQASLFVEKTKDSNWAMNYFIQFFKFQIENRVNVGIITSATLKNYFKAAKLFCVMNDIILNWVKITKGFPKVKYYSDDRAPTIEEIRKLMEYPDRRIKPIIYTMGSSGIRLGAWDYLKWKHITPLTDESGELVSAKVLVYAGDSEEYYSFLTPEAYNSLKDWMEFRSKYGEKISGESWLMRDIWQTSNMKYGAKFGLATNPKKLKSTGIKRLIEQALWEQGIRYKLPQGLKRHEWKAAHGFRVFFKTRTEQAMKPINVELTMGHNIGLSGSYYKPTEKEVLEDYLTAVNLLTISNAGRKLERQIHELKQQNKDNEYLIKSKLEETCKELQLLRQQESNSEDVIAALSDRVDELWEKLSLLNTKD